MPSWKGVRPTSANSRGGLERDGRIAGRDATQMSDLQRPLNPEADKIFFAMGQAGLTFSQVNRLVSATCATILKRAALAPGDKVAILMPKPPSFALALLALMRMRVVSVPLNTRLKPRELAWQVKNAECRLILCEPETLALTSEMDADVFKLPAASLRDPVSEFADYGAMKFNDDFAIIHTSGTSGRPKAAVLTHGNIYHSALASALKLERPRDERWLCVLPLYHVGGLSIILRSLIYGSAVEFGPSAPFDVQETNRVLSENPITLVSLVPTILQRLLQAKTEPWNRHLRLILLGGEAPAPELVARCIAERLPIATTYGLTEAASQVATALPDLVYKKPGSVGKPLMTATVRIIDENGVDAAPGVPGEVLIKGGSVMRGYYGDPDASHAAIRAGWLHTGDIGYFDEDGDLFILQRREDLIVSGGENVYPAEVERVLRSHPDVAEAVVFGIPDAEWGQGVAAVIERCVGASVDGAVSAVGLGGQCRRGSVHVPLHDPGEPTPPSSEAIMKYARERLAGYKVPRRVVFVDALPRSAAGKIQRREARRLFDDAISSG